VGGGGAAAGGLLHSSPTPVFQDGVRPVTFKSVIGRGHVEFSTMRQQDSEEFLTHLVQTLRRDAHKFKSQSVGTLSSLLSLLIPYVPNAMFLQTFKTQRPSSPMHGNNVSNAPTVKKCGM
jgi:hypothetical protein